jgi:hypothetical protein
MTKNMNLKELNEPIRSFLTQLKEGDAALVTDDTGLIQYSVVRFRQASSAERTAAWREIQQIQQKVGKTMAAAERTEEQLDNLLREDD